jgi:flagellin
MPLYVLTNIPSMRAQRHLGVSQRGLNTTLERLASGKRINSAKDDPAGLLLSTRLGKSVTAWQSGSNSLNMGLDLIATADSFLTILVDDLERLYQLASDAMNGLLSNGERSLLNEEYSRILPEMQRLALNTKFLDQTLLAGGMTVSIRVGEGTGNNVTIQIGALTYGGGALAISNTSITSQGAASAALQALSNAFSSIGQIIAEVGAQGNAFTKSVDAQNALVENLTAAKGRILNADLAVETTNLTNQQIVVQSGISALVQANSAQTLALALLGGGR